MINYRGIELDRTAYARDIPKVATRLKDGGGGLISTCPTREAVKRGWGCALLPPGIGGAPPNVTPSSSTEQHRYVLELTPVVHSA